jgi:hypothetical protein
MESMKPNIPKIHVIINKSVIVINILYTGEYATAGISQLTSCFERRILGSICVHGSFQQERSEFGCRCLLLLDSCFADS